MHKSNAVQLRLALSAAALGAVLAAATVSGAHRSRPPSTAMESGRGPIVATSTSTIRKPTVESAQASHGQVVTAPEARPRSALDTHEGER